MSIRHIHNDIRETDILGPDTRVLVVRANEEDRREWLSAAPVCDGLGTHRIAHCGIMHASRPFEIVRTKLSGTFFFACFEGEGLVLIDGEWKTVGAGQACVQPPFIPNALKTRRRKLWKFCWVRYQETPQTQSIVSLHAPALGDFDAAPLKCAIEGLHAEVQASRSLHVQQKWSDLTHGYVDSFAQPFRGNDRLIDVWKAVEGHLAEDWSLDRLAAIACVSKEHLRRLCYRSLGRSPVQHIAFLRMHYAAELLMTTDHKISQIARMVGYANQFAFSDTFKRWLGCRPSVYRKQGSS